MVSSRDGAPEDRKLFKKVIEILHVKLLISRNLSADMVKNIRILEILSEYGVQGNTGKVPQNGKKLL